MNLSPFCGDLLIEMLKRVVRGPIRICDMVVFLLCLFVCLILCLEMLCLCESISVFRPDPHVAATSITMQTALDLAELGEEKSQELGRILTELGCDVNDLSDSAYVEIVLKAIDRHAVGSFAKLVSAVQKHFTGTIVHVRVDCGVCTLGHSVGSTIVLTLLALSY